MELYDVVMKLIGEIEPVGETHEDNHRFENLKNLTELVDRLLGDIQDVADTNVGRVEFSLSRAGKMCENFLHNVRYK